jgi:hypothetical protein
MRIIAFVKVPEEKYEVFHIRICLNGSINAVLDDVSTCLHVLLPPFPFPINLSDFLQQV